MVRRTAAAAGEESLAAARAVLGLTAGVGLMAAVSFGLMGDPLALVALPTIVTVVLVARGEPFLAGYAAAAVWLAFLPHAREEALVVPLVMAAGCLAIAVGPARMLDWITEDLCGGHARKTAREGGWIEEG